ncbi:MAG: hypothetical protein KR126chlam1_00477 [Chlamydiae bacterium]|nr:hypothetical protein [Chlamydiota bacterium]
MPDAAVFPLRNKPATKVKRLYSSFFLVVFALFMSLGNFFRLFSLPYFPSSFSIIEAALYLFALPIYFAKWRKSQLLFVMIFLSFCYGTLLHGFEEIALLYSLKLIGMITAGVAVGEVLFFLFADEIDLAMRYIIGVFTLVLVIGFVLLLFFPAAQSLFQLLGQYGVKFHGDPHCNRFISSFFDPNYYSAIACIPLLLCWFYRDKSFYFFALALLIFSSILLSWSRSGIATALFLMGGMSIGALSRLSSLSIDLKRLTAGGLYLGLLLISPFIFSEEWAIFLSRTFGMFDDPSAYARLQTFQEAWPYLSAHPFFGNGYNYFAALLREEVGILAPDSSMLLTLGNFGAIPTLFFLFFGGIWSVRRGFFQPKKNIFPMNLYFWLYIYMLVCILFTSQFNNLLYYQFWLIPIIAIFTYLDRYQDIT